MPFSWKLIGSAAIILGLTATTTLAADIVPPSSGWDGFYIGANAGYDWARLESKGFGSAYDYYSGPGCESDASLDWDCFDKPNQSDSSFIGGLQAGYNWTMDRALIGVEADVQATSLEAKSKLGYYDGGEYLFDPNHSVATTIDAFGTARLRAGYLITDDLLGYVTGGLAVLHLKGDFKDDTDNDTRGDYTLGVGWTAGAGLEYALSDAVSLKAEWLYISSTTNLQGGTAGSEGENFNHQSTVNQSVARVGVNYHFAGTGATASDDQSSGYDPRWNGLYVGANAGYDWANIDNKGYGADAPGGSYDYSGPGCKSVTSLDTDCLNDPNMSDGSWLGGVQLGYNWTRGRGLVGIEADVQATNLETKTKLGYYSNGDYVFDPGHSVTTSVDALGTVRLRGGYLLTDNLLGYVTGGLAVMHVKGNFKEPPQDADDTGDYTLQAGWTAGGGIEYAVSDRFSIKGEGLYVRSNSDLYGGAASREQETYTWNSDIAQVIARVGVNYHL